MNYLAINTQTTVSHTDEVIVTICEMIQLTQNSSMRVVDRLLNNELAQKRLNAEQVVSARKSIALFTQSLTGDAFSSVTK